MHVLLLGLFGLLGQFLPVMVARILTSLGLGLVTGAAFAYILTVALGFVEGWTGRLVGDAAALARMAGVHAGLALIASAFTIRVAWDSTAIAIKKV